MVNAFEYGDALLPPSAEEGAEPQIDSNQPYLNLATFRMVVLAEEALETFFETDLRTSFRLNSDEPTLELPPASSGLLGGFWNTITSDDNKKLFNKFSDDLGRAVGRHQVIHKPSIGRFTSIEETRPRESLLTPAMRRSASKQSLVTSDKTSLTAESSSGDLLSPASAVSVPELPAVPEKDKKHADELTDDFGALSMVAQANAALLGRTPFAIDDAKDDDEESDFDSEVGEDDGVLDEVDAFLEAHDTSGLSDADKALANGACSRGSALPASC
jgi:hypothetical protein